MSTPGNSINDATTGISGFSGTSFVGSPATQHCVQIGGATTSTLASVTNGTTGQFLGANTSADPTWQTVNVFPPSPNSQISLVDDFIGANTSGITGVAASTYAWFISGSNEGFVTTNSTENGHPGLLENGSISGVSANLFLGNNAGSVEKNFILGGGTLTINWVFKIATLSNGTNRYTLRLGLGDTANGAQTNGCYILYSDNVNSGEWQFLTTSASSSTTSNSSVAADTSWHKLQIIVNAAASSVSFAIDGVSLGTAITTNIPTTAITPFVCMTASVGTSAAGAVLIDLFYLSEILTSAR